MARKSAIQFDTRDLDFKLRQIPQEIFDATLEGLVEVAKAMENDARASAPQGKTGNLKKGIGSGPVKAGFPQAEVYSKAPHSHLIELGTTLRFHKSGKSVGRITANPFFSTAVKRHQRKTRGVLLEKNRRALKSLSRKKGFVGPPKPGSKIARFIGE